MSLQSFKPSDVSSTYISSTQPSNHSPVCLPSSSDSQPSVILIQPLNQPPVSSSSGSQPFVFSTLSLSQSPIILSSSPGNEPQVLSSSTSNQSSIDTAYPNNPGPMCSSAWLPRSYPYTNKFDVLVSLEEGIGRDQWEGFCRRLENGFDVTTGEVYNNWKALVMQNTGCPCKSACSC